MGSLRGTEVYYQKFMELQEKLRKSEEERLKLEMKFNEMVQCTREEEQAYYRKLRHQYKRFLEEDRRRQERNEAILRALERVEGRASMLAAKTERYKFLRKQYQSFVRRLEAAAPEESRIRPRTEEASKDASSGYRSSQDFHRTAPNLGMSNEIIEKYFQSLNSPERKNLEQKTNQRYPFTMPSTFADYSKEGVEGVSASEGNNVISVADEIMASIYSKRKANGQQSAYNGFFDDRNDEVLKSIRSHGNILPHSEGTDHQRLQLLKGFKENDYSSDVRKVNGVSGMNERKCFSNSMNITSDDHASKSLPRSKLFENNNHGIEVTSYGFSDDCRDQIKGNDLLDDEGKYKKCENNKQNKESVIQTVKEPTKNGEREESSLIDEQPPEELNQVLVKDQVNNLAAFNAHSVGDDVELQDNIQRGGTRIADVEHDNENVLTVSNNTTKVVEEYQKRQNDETEGKQKDVNGIPLQKTPAHEEYKSEKTSSDHKRNSDEGEGQLAESFNNKEQDAVNEDSHQKDENYEQTASQDQSKNEEPVHYEGSQMQYHGQAYESYSKSGQPFAQYDEDCQQMQQYQYDENRQSLQEYHENGQPVQENVEQYDENGQSLQQYGENGQSLQQYDENGQPLQDYRQNVEQYDENGQPLQQYDENGQPVQQYDVNGQFLQQYDEHGQPYGQYDAYGQQSQVMYDENGQIVQQYAADGQQAVPYDQYGQRYDENGQLIQQPYTEQNQQYYGYDENGQPLQTYQQQDETCNPTQYLAGESQEQAYQEQETNETAQCVSADAPETDVESKIGIEQETPADEESTKHTKDDNIAEEGQGESKVVEEEKKPHKVMEMLDTDTESSKQDTKVSHDSDFDISAASQK